MLGRAAVRVFAYAPVCDMRKQIDGLSTLVRERLERDPQCGDLYLFRNRRGDMVKILFFDHGGYCLLVKRLEKGTFRLQLALHDGVLAREMTQAELSRLLTKAEVVQEMAAGT